MTCIARLLTDDTKMYTNEPIEDRDTILQDTVFGACFWPEKWQLKFNDKKSKHLGMTDQEINYMTNSDGVITKITKYKVIK